MAVTSCGPFAMALSSASCRLARRLSRRGWNLNDVQWIRKVDKNETNSNALQDVRNRGRSWRNPVSSRKSNCAARDKLQVYTDFRSMRPRGGARQGVHAAHYVFALRQKFLRKSSKRKTQIRRPGCRSCSCSLFELHHSFLVSVCCVS